LREAVIEVCRPFAEITNIDLIADGERGYFCYVRLATPDQTYALMREIGGFTFGNGVCFSIPRKWNEKT
jgi:hypothetical protein